VSILVVDVGTSGLRAAVVRQDGSVHFLNYESCRPDTPSSGLVEFDPQKMADAVLRVCNATIEQSKNTDKVEAVGITNQRASTVMWSKLAGKTYEQYLIASLPPLNTRSNLRQIRRLQKRHG
jgi:glycerol kinase